MQPDIWNLVLKDMEDRRLIGIERYGRPVLPFTGLSYLREAYEEILDLAVYLRTEIHEKERLLQPKKDV